MGANDSRERALADGQFGSGSPATWYCGLSTTTSGDDGSGFTEPSGGSYGRVAVTNNVTNFPAATTVAGRTVKRNGTKITFPNPTGSWGTLSEYGWFLTSSGGQPEYTNPIDAPIAPRAGNTPVEFDVGEMEMEFA